MPDLDDAITPLDESRVGWCEDCSVWTERLHLVGEVKLCDPCKRTWERIEALHAR